MRKATIAGLGTAAVIAVGVVAYYFYWPVCCAPPPTPVPPVPCCSQPAPAPTPPTAPKPDASAIVPSFDVVRVGPDGQAVIAGRAAPGAEVTVFDGDKPIATVTADQRGEWVVMPQAPLAPGNHELGLGAKMPDGSIRKSESVVVVAVPETSQTTAGGANPQSPLAVLVPRQGAGAARALQVPGGSAGEGRILFLDVVQYDGTGHLSVSGRAPPDGRVLLYLENKPVGDTRADRSGDWNARPADPVPVGRYRLRADLVDNTGKVLARVLIQFRRIEVPDELAGNQFLVVQPGNSLWRIARRTYGTGVLYTEIYQANRSQIDDPDLIYPDQIVSLPPG
jgi:nucleoid-associated protein YgaU